MTKRCRMISEYVVGQLDFIDLPYSAHALYLQLLLRSDDEGFVRYAKKIVRRLGVKKDALERLVERGFVIYFPENDVALISHFYVNNKITHPIPTDCVKEKAMVYVENMCYFLKENCFPKPTENDAKKSTKTATKNGTESGTKTVTQIGTESGTEGGTELSTQKELNSYPERDSKTPPSPLIDSVKEEIKKEESKEIKREEGGEETKKEASTPVASAQELAILFPTLRLDVAPTHPISEYKKMARALLNSSFARMVIRSLSSLHKHQERLLNGEWDDYKKPKESESGILKQTYTPDDMSSIITKWDEIDWDNVQ